MPKGDSSGSYEWSGDGEMPAGAWEDYSYSEPGAKGPKGSWSKDLDSAESALRQQSGRRKRAVSMAIADA